MHKLWVYTDGIPSLLHIAPHTMVSLDRDAILDEIEEELSAVGVAPLDPDPDLPADVALEVANPGLSKDTAKIPADNQIS